jgi:hypothetical protein
MTLRVRNSTRGSGTYFVLSCNELSLALILPPHPTTARCNTDFVTENLFYLAGYSGIMRLLV